MYEVFFNECQLSFVSEMNISSKDNVDHIIEIQTFADFFVLLEALENGDWRLAERIDCVVGQGWPETLAENVTQIPAAGGLVCDCRGRFLFIRRFDRWDLPKGGIEANESAPEAAIREVQEECGLDQLEIRKELPATFHLYRSPHIQAGSNWVLKKTLWFEMFHHGSGATSPQTDEAIESVRWFEREELAEVFASTYASLKKMLRAYFR